MGFFLTQVGILPETVETKDEELRKVYYSHKPRAIEMKLAHNYIIMAQLLIPQTLLSLHQGHPTRI